MLSKLQEIKDRLEKAAEIEGEDYKTKCLRNDDVDWLVEQAQKLENLMRNILGDGK